MAPAKCDGLQYPVIGVVRVGDRVATRVGAREPLPRYPIRLPVVRYIDFDQLTRVSQLVLNTAKTVANLDHRPLVDGPKPDPQGQCRQ